MTFESFPFIVGWELTLACNLRCRHCASSAGKRRAAELNTAEALAVCDQFPDLMVQEVDFTGGEPLMRRDWPRIADQVAGHGIRTKLVTNGVLITKQVARTMKSVGLCAVGVSIDGLPVTHDRIRGDQCLYDQTLSGAMQLIDAGLSVTAITTVNGLNIEELPAIFETLVNRGFDRWQVQPIFGLGRSQQFPELALSQDDFMHMGEFVKEVTPLAYEKGLELLPGDSYGYFSEYDNSDLPWHGCGAGVISCGIASDGKVKGCLSLPNEFIEGDLRQRDLWDIWYDSDAFAYTRRFRPDQLGGACQGCEWGEQCQGGCTAMAYATTGDTHNNPYCFHALQYRSAQIPVTVKA